MIVQDAPNTMGEAASETKFAGRPANSSSREAIMAGRGSNTVAGYQCREGTGRSMCFQATASNISNRLVT